MKLTYCTGRGLGILTSALVTALFNPLAAPVALAVSPVNPDGTGGLLLNNIAPPAATPSAPSDNAAPALPPLLGAPVSDERKFAVSSFEFSGNTVLSDKQLAVLLAELLNRSFNLAELSQIATAITAYYRQQLGYPLATAIIYPDRIQGGKLPIEIAEGRFGKINVSGDARLGEARIRRHLNAIISGELISNKSLQRDLLLLTDLPGSKVISAFKTGTAAGTADFNLQVDNAQRVSGSVDFDNSGSRFFGRNQFGGALAVNSPTGVGDQLSVRALSSDEDFTYLQAGYSAPLGYNGTRLGVTFAYSDYRLGEELAVFGAAGNYESVSLSLLHPLLRSAAFNVYGTLGFDYKNSAQSFALLFQDGSNLEQTRTDRLRVLTASLLGNLRQQSGALNTVSATWHQGLGDVLNGLPRTGDPQTSSRPQATGDFSRFSLDLKREQPLGKNVSLLLHATGQLSNAPLVSAEQFTLGGPAGVRAYSFAEALGDEGYLLSAQLDWQPRELDWPVFGGKRLGEVLKLSAFYEFGETSLNDPCRTVAGTGGSNSEVCEVSNRQLSGAGLGMSLDWPGNVSLKATYAWQLGKDALVEKDYDERLLVQLVKSF